MRPSLMDAEAGRVRAPVATQGGSLGSLCPRKQAGFRSPEAARWGQARQAGVDQTLLGSVQARRVAHCRLCLCRMRLSLGFSSYSGLWA